MITPQRPPNHTFQGIIVDLTVFNEAERLDSFLKSKLYKKHRVGVASDIYFMIKDEKWEELSKLLQNWEWNVQKRKLTEWHKRQEFRALCKDIIGLVDPCRRILEELSNEERNLLEQISKAIEPGSPRTVEIAKELIVTSVVKKFPVLSYTRHAKRWFKDCKSVVIMEITDAKNSVSKAKRDIKIRIKESGWSGFIGLFIFGWVVNKVLEIALPAPVGHIVGFASGGSLIVGVLANGKKIEE